MITKMLRALLGLMLLAFAVVPASAQNGRVVGRVVDAQTGAGLSNVTVEVVGTPLGALSGMDGRFIINNVPSGSVTLRAQSIGYAAKAVSDVRLDAGGAVEQNITLDPAAVQMMAIDVTAAAERGSVNRAIDQQRTATGIVNSVTAEQIAKSPDSDAGAAMQRVSGMAVDGGKYANARGLGDRYTTTSLNGARIPSPEPERKLVPLDMFPSGLIQTITTTKTFTPDLSADFSGAQINIKTREFPAKRQFTVSAGAGFNSRVTGATLFAAPRTGLEWIGMGGSDRGLPGSVSRAGDFTGTVTGDDFNTMVNDFRNAWTPQRETGRGNSSFGMSLGGTDPILGQNIAYLLSGSYGYGEEVRDQEVRARTQAGSSGEALEVDRFSGSTGRTTMMLGGLTNVSTLIGQNMRLFFNGTYNRTADNEARLEFGSSENYGGLAMQIQRLRYVERGVYSAQLGAEHALGQHSFDWSLTGSGTRRYEPDRSEFVYARAADNEPFRWFGSSNEGAVRTFGDLTESSLDGQANYKLAFGSSHVVKFGALYRTTDRDASNNAYSISGRSIPVSALSLEPELLFDGRFSAPGHQYLRVTPISQGGSYTAQDRVAAAYGMVDVALTDRVRVIGGARFERSELDLVAQSTIGQDKYPANPSYSDVLPSLAVNMSLSEAQNLRLSVSQTLARPEYRELANVQYREVIGGDNLIGNPDLKRTLIQNADIRWEWYPAAGEVLSAAVFAKHFENPIERVYRATSGTSVVTFVNAESAQNLGVELELRKRLGFLNESLETLTFFSNITLMDSEIKIPESASSQTNSNRAMVSQAPYVVNAGFTFAPEWRGSSATLLLNVVGDRIVNAGEIPLPDVYEQSRNVLDLSIRTTLLQNVSLKIDTKNLLDAPYELTQGDVTRESYHAGRIVSFGLSWNR